MRHTLVKFVNNPIEITDNQHEYLRIESRIQASILAGKEELPNGVVEFVSSAHWFQAGVRLYHARRRQIAYRVLKKAYSNRLEFTTASRTELARYFCLSATRNRKYREAENCIDFLDRVYQTKGMASFLRADLLEHRGKFIEAIKEYEESLKLNVGKDRRLERTYRPLIRCILYAPYPNFQQAEKYAIRWLQLRKSIFSLATCARVYLHLKYKGRTSQHPVPAEIDKLYDNALSELESEPGVGSAHFELKAEEAQFTGEFDSALDYMDKAIKIDPRFELRGERWRLMAKSGDLEIVNLEHSWIERNQLYDSLP